MAAAIVYSEVQTLRTYQRVEAVDVHVSYRTGEVIGQVSADGELLLRGARANDDRLGTARI